MSDRQLPEGFALMEDGALEGAANHGSRLLLRLVLGIFILAFSPIFLWFRDNFLVDSIKGPRADEAILLYLDAVFNGNLEYAIELSCAAKKPELQEYIQGLTDEMAVDGLTLDDYFSEFEVDFSGVTASIHRRSNLETSVYVSGSALYSNSAYEEKEAVPIAQFFKGGLTTDDSVLVLLRNEGNGWRIC